MVVKCKIAQYGKACKDRQRDFPKAKAWYADQEDPDIDLAERMWDRKEARETSRSHDTPAFNRYSLALSH